MQDGVPHPTSIGLHSASRWNFGWAGTPVGVAKMGLDAFESSSFLQELHLKARLKDQAYQIIIINIPSVTYI